MRILLGLHSLLLLLASTKFTVVTSLLGHTGFDWCFYKYGSSNGWGVPYVSDYRALEVVTFLLAFGIGAIGFLLALKGRLPILAFLGLLLSLVGGLSFTLEGSHWLIDHNRSWIAFSPVVMWVLALLVSLPNPSQSTRTAALSTSTAALSTRTAALSTRTAALSTRTAALSTRTAALSTRTAALSTSTAALSTSTAALSTSTAALSTRTTEPVLTEKEKTALCERFASDAGEWPSPSSYALTLPARNSAKRIRFGLR
jgi:hypothetical protein